MQTHNIPFSYYIRIMLSRAAIGGPFSAYAYLLPGEKTYGVDILYKNTRAIYLIVIIFTVDKDLLHIV